MTQHTLVALYGKKEQALSHLIQWIWTEIAGSALKDHFLPYDLDQIHTTLIGMEKMPDFPEPFNLNIWEQEGEKKRMVFTDIRTTLTDFFPMNVQFGGFDEKYEIIKSVGKTLYERSFQLQWSTGRVVLIGWPTDQHQVVVKDLVDFRQVMYLRHHILHKYREDNDCYLVLGTLKLPDDWENNSALKEAGKDLEHTIQQWLSKNRTTISIALEDLSIVEYQDPTLELTSSKVWPFNTFEAVS